MKRWPIVITVGLLVGALWFLLWSDERGPGPRATGVGDDGKGGSVAASALESAGQAAAESAAIAAPAAERARLPATMEAGDELSAAADVTAEPGWARLELTVLGNPSGSPVPGLYFDFEAQDVSALPTDSDGAELDIERESSLETDGAGRATFELLAELPLVLEVRGIGLEEALAKLELEPFAPDEVRALEVRIDEARLPRFWIRVVAAEDGAPLPEARILEVDAYGTGLYTDGPLDAARWLERAPLARPDAGGLAVLPISRHIQMRFAAVAEGRGPAFFVQERSAERPDLAYEVKLARPAALDTAVVDLRGRPVGGARVRLDAKFADLGGPGARASVGLIFGSHAVTSVTDGAGHAVFEGLTAGAELRASLLAPGFGEAWQVTGAPVPALGPGERRELTLVARPPTDVHGVARDQHGAPAAGAELLLLRDSGQWGEYLSFNSSGSAERTATLGEDGRFRWQGVPAGRWIVAPKTLRDPNRRFTQVSEPELVNLFAPVPTRFELTGEEASRELRLELWRDLYVRGVVVDGQERPSGDAYIQARLGSDAGFVLEHSEPDGTFVIGPLPDLPVRLEASDPTAGSSSEEVEAHPGDEGLTLRLYVGGRLILRTVEAGTGEGVECDFTAWRMDGTGEVQERAGYGSLGPELEWDGLTPGTWHVLARGPSTLVGFRGQLEVRAEETTGPVVLELEPAGTLVITRPATAAAGERRVVVRYAGVPIAEYDLAPGGVAEVSLPSGEVEVIEYDMDGEPLPPRSVGVPRSASVALLLSAG